MLLDFAAGGRAEQVLEGSEPRDRRQCVRVAGVVAIGLPVRIWAFEDLALLGRPLSVVQGTKDEFGSIAEVKAVVERAVPAGRTYEVDGASHLFPGRTKEAASRVVEAVEDILQGLGGSAS